MTMLKRLKILNRMNEKYHVKQSFSGKYKKNQKNIMKKNESSNYSKNKHILQDEKEKKRGNTINVVRTFGILKMKKRFV